MRYVWKFPLDQEINNITVPVGGIIRHVDNQGGRLMVWIEGDGSPSIPRQQRLLQVVGTGWEVPDGGPTAYVGTVNNNGYIWHVYELNPPVPVSV